MSSLNYGRVPCPGRILDDLGGGFAMGCTAGGIMYFIKGIPIILIVGVWNSAKSQRMIGGLKHVFKRAPLLGGLLIQLMFYRKLCLVGWSFFVR